MGRKAGVDEESGTQGGPGIDEGPTYITCTYKMKCLIIFLLAEKSMRNVALQKRLTSDERGSVFPNDTFQI